MKNIFIFAHYDKDCIIDDYVIFYLKNVKNIADTIIFSSANNLSSKELSKLDGIVDFKCASDHREYDFGSYKRGWQIACKERLLDDADCLTFANDSCYGPFYPLVQIYDEMANKTCNFWGITCNENNLNGQIYDSPKSNNQHIQSYFIVFKKEIFQSDLFKNFLENIKEEPNKSAVIENYEIGLSVLLCNNGFELDSVYPEQIGKYNINDMTNRHKVKDVFIFMKTSLPKVFYFQFLCQIWYKKISLFSDYPICVLKKHIKRIRSLESINLKEIVKQFRRTILSHKTLSKLKGCS